MALRLLSLPREIGAHPETGKPITASIGRYGPYLAHDGKYARLQSTAEVFETGMNAAVAKLADSNKGAARGGSREPIATLGDSPVTGKPVKVMEGRFGPYVTDGVTNATLPKGTDPATLDAEQALALLAERAAKGPAKGKKKPARRAAKR
jgi:DNA topoisomerase-1